MSVQICYRNKQFTYEISEKMTIKNLNEEIGKKLNISEFSLKLDKILLLEDKPVRKYLVTHLTLSDNNSRNINIEINDITFDLKITDLNSKEIPEKASATISVAELKTKILSKLRLTGDNWEMKNIGTVIENGKILSDCIAEKVFVVTFQIFPVYLNNIDRNYTINVTKDTTVKEFRKLGFEKIGEAINEFHILFNGQILDFVRPITIADFMITIITGIDIVSVMEQENRDKDNLTLDSYGVQPNCTLKLVAKLIGGHECFVSTR